MMGEKLFEECDHSIHVEYEMVAGKTVRIWCPDLDEEMVALHSTYFRHCPMCGDDIDVPQYPS